MSERPKGKQWWLDVAYTWRDLKRQYPHYALEYEAKAQECEEMAERAK